MISSPQCIHVGRRRQRFAPGRHWLTVLLAVGVLAAPVTRGDTDVTQWSQTLEKISSGVVSIRVDVTRAFDTEWSQSTQATGFVVDAKRGLILTNRHVVTASPVVAQAVFLNHEEVELLPVYRDPVHDFGFYRYDPEQLRYIEPYEFTLKKENARIGREIRVVGNDAGEQLSILAGTIAKLDREAPDYGAGKYNDFNTFYLQAASGTSGGSSGSPVIDINGDVVALNAGANSAAASSFFLPLDRIERALALLQADEPITRGTLQTVFVHKPFDELRRLGLSDNSERLARQLDHHYNGMLVVDQVVPGALAADVLQSGDILLELNGEPLASFIPLEKVLDAEVGNDVTLTMERGGETLTHTIRVQDLHAISPSEFIQVGDAILHRLSYQQARHFNMPPEGVYVADPGYIFSTAAIPRAAVITEVDGEPTPDVDALGDVLAQLADGDRAQVRYYTYADPANSVVGVVRMDRKWFPAAHCVRNDSLGFWPCQALDPGPANSQPVSAASATFPESDDARAERLAPSLVRVNFDMPYTASGVGDLHYHGTGVIVDAERGLVVVDRNTVPVALGDVKITVAGSIEIPARVRYIHPLHNLSVISYDPDLLGDTPVKAATFDVRPVKPGDKLWVVGLKIDDSVRSVATEVASLDPVSFPLSRTFRFRDTNLETVSVVNAANNVDGVLADKRGRVVSLWSSFAYQGGQSISQTNMGVPAEVVVDLVDHVVTGEPIYSLEAEFVKIPLSAARRLDLPDDWVSKLEGHNPQKRQVLKVQRTVAGSDASRLLRPGDLILSVNGKIVNQFREVEKATQRPSVSVSIWRGDDVMRFDVQTATPDTIGIQRALLWAGALLQEPHRALAAQRGIEPDGVYVAYFSYGSPSTRYGLWGGRRITAVDGMRIENLDSFIDAIEDKQDRDSVRLKTVTWNNVVEVITLKLDHKYWPTFEVFFDGETWQRRPLSADAMMPEDRVVRQKEGGDTTAGGAP
ncbi:MAG: trypsin-like peptidase domain-containing protein [Pseudomonadota bacterium]